MKLRPVAAALVAALAAIALPVAAEGPTNRLGAVALNVADLERSERFYEEVLDFERVGVYPPGADDPLELFLAIEGSAGATLVLAHFDDSPLPEEKSRYGRLVVTTSDAGVVAKRAEAAGASVRPVEIPGENPPIIVFITDPDGYQIEVYQAAPP
ncbi:MAG: VOC family protein [Thermoanaerobaculia bacterium]|nr:VOC family protein [Thermoanaerobaculia bacterium]